MVHPAGPPGGAGRRRKRSPLVPSESRFAPLFFPSGAAALRIAFTAAIGRRSDRAAAACGRPGEGKGEDGTVRRAAGTTLAGAVPDS